MTAVVSAPAPAVGTAGPSRARLRDLVAAEWIKLWSLRSTPIVLGALVGWYLYRGYTDAQSAYRVWRGMPAALRDQFDPSGPFRGPEWFLLAVIVGTVGALAIVGEHSSGLIRTTFTAVPDRLRVATAKLLVVVAVMTAVGALITAGMFALTALVLRGDGVPFSVTEHGATSLLLSTTLFVPLCALVGMALGALIHNTAASVVAITAVFIVLPFVFKSPGTRWAIDVANSLPCYAWTRLTATGHGHIVGSGPSYAAAWTAFACWPIISAAIVVAVLRRRDV